jgi:glycosyltransferase involved in cell wall biosynthesis
MGHAVEILLGKHELRSLDPHWEEVYGAAGVRLRAVPRPEERVEPWEFSHTHSVMLGLRDDPPDVVIAHDFGAPAYSALRLRQAGLGFESTLFVVFCHGPRRYVIDLSPGLALGDLRAVLGVSVLEQAAVELADVVVSPSAFLLEWMRMQGWSVPEHARVIPYFTRAGATGEATGPITRASPDALRRLTFFGRVDERKGLKIFSDALARLEPNLLESIEVEFVGKTTRTWTRERVERLLPASARIVFAGELDQSDALDRLARPGTLVVMPSLQENSPNAVYECLEREIPFIASNVGGVPELIATGDRPRVLFEPTAESLEAALRRVFSDGTVPASARPAFDADDSFERWREVVELGVAPRTGPRHDDAEYVLVPGGKDALRKTLVSIQRATGADAVTCGVRLPDGGLRFFAGDVGGLAALANGYGTVALIRRDLLGDVRPSGEERDGAWPVLAQLATSGASIFSVPLPLTDAVATPGTVEDDPAAALRAVQALERGLPDPARGAARLAAGLAGERATAAPRGRRLPERARRVLRGLF